MLENIKAVLETANRNQEGDRTRFLAFIASSLTQVVRKTRYREKHAIPVLDVDVSR